MTTKFKEKFLRADRIVVFVALLICSGWVLSSMSAFSKNWDLENKMYERESQKQLLELDIERLIAENAYRKTPEFQDLFARERLSKMSEGEKMIVIPKSDSQEMNQTPAEARSKTPTNRTDELSNFNQWMLFLFGS